MKSPIKTKVNKRFRKTGITELGEFTKKVETLGEITSIDGSQWRLCLHPFEYRRDMNPNLGALQDNSNGNPFFNSAFLAASRDRVTRNKIYQLILWEVSGNNLSAKFVLPVSHFPKTIFLTDYFQSLTHPYAPFGDPLFQTGDEISTLTRLAELLKIAFENNFPPLVMDYVSANSPINKLQEVCHNQIGVTSTQLGKRASINGSLANEPNAMMSKKRKRELNRQLKKLREQGKVTFEKVSDPIDVILRFEEFLLLETRTWKGKHGTSIHTIKRDAAFARQSVSDLAKEGKCEIFSMRLNNQAVASTILFKSDGNYFPWKTAFETRYAHFSPGSQLMLRLSEDITAREDFKCADSLAKFGNSWMTGLWPDQISSSKMIVATDFAMSQTISKRMNFSAAAKTLIKKLLRRN